MRAFVHFLREETAASAAEFALVVFPFVALVLGIIGLSMLLYANQTLQFATEKAARYYSVQTANATNSGGTVPAPSDIVAYAQSAYTGPGDSPSFSATSAACGYQVTGTTTLPFNTGIYNTSVTLNSSACFP